MAITGSIIGELANLRGFGAGQSAAFAAVEVPFSTFGATASFSGDFKDGVRYDLTSPPLGSDSRFLFPSLAQQSVDTWIPQ